MKSRAIPFRDGPYRGRTGTIRHAPGAGWPTEVRIPYPVDAPYTVLTYRPKLNDDGNPYAMEWVALDPVVDMVAASKVGPVVFAQDGTTWTEGEDVSGGWVCTTESTECGRMEAR
jgi:hypothetical protein